MFLEWKAENAPFRDVMLYFQELYIGAFLKEFYFSKGNITSAKKVADTCDEYEINRYKYVHTCFVAKKEEVMRIGFRYFNAPSYFKMFIDRATDPTWYGYGSLPTPVFDRIKRETLKLSREKTAIVDAMINGNLTPEAFAYLVFTGQLKVDDYSDVIRPLASTFARPAKKVELWAKRGVLPKEYEKMATIRNFSEWCRNAG